MFSQQISFEKCGYGVFLITVSKTGLATNPFTLHKGINLQNISYRTQFEKLLP